MSTSELSFSNAIGIFDSGVGGLSILLAIHALMPQEDLVYVADSAYAPYGDKDEDLIQSRTIHLGQWLAHRGVKGITIACNTATVVAARALRQATHLPIVAIEPAIKPAAQMSRSGRIGVLGTRQTIQSESVARLCHEYGQGKDIYLQACPGWVECVESGELHSAKTRLMLHRYLDPLMDQGVDTLVLGCTHYPFLRNEIALMMGPSVVLIDPAQAVAKELARRIEPNQDRSRKGCLKFYSSSADPKIQTVFEKLLETQIEVTHDVSLI